MVELLHEGPPVITDRQRQVIELIAAGYSNEEVGRRLGISPRTAKAHSDVLRQTLRCARRRPHPWYQGTAASSDVAALALGIADAAEKVLQGAGQRLREWLPTSREPEEEVHVMADLLAEQLTAWPEDNWFAIDDYQLLSSTAA